MSFHQETPILLLRSNPPKPLSQWNLLGLAGKFTRRNEHLIDQRSSSLVDCPTTREKVCMTEFLRSRGVFHKDPKLKL